MKILQLSLITVCLSTGFASAYSKAFDYKGYNELLKKYAHPTGVDYKSWSKNSEDKSKLDAILAEWSEIDSRKMKKKNKAAFRINLYNATMVDVVLDHYPISTVTKVGGSFAIFDKKIIKTPAGMISLNTLEKKTLLRDFADSRIHFAVNCASVSCPPLRNEAFTGDKLEDQLNEQATRFANSSHAFQSEGATAKYSELFQWYKKDFKTSNPAIYLNKYRANKITTTLRVDWIKYDWGLNQSK